MGRISPQIIHWKIGFSIINHPFLGGFPPIFGNTHMSEVNKVKVFASCGTGSRYGMLWTYVSEDPAKWSEFLLGMWGSRPFHTLQHSWKNIHRFPLGLECRCRFVSREIWCFPILLPQNNTTTLEAPFSARSARCRTDEMEFWILGLKVNINDEATKGRLGECSFQPPSPRWNQVLQPPQSLWIHHLRLANNKSIASVGVEGLENLTPGPDGFFFGGDRVLVMITLARPLLSLQSLFCESSPHKDDFPVPVKPQTTIVIGPSALPPTSTSTGDSRDISSQATVFPWDFCMKNHVKGSSGPIKVTQALPSSTCQILLWPLEFPSAACRPCRHREIQGSHHWPRWRHGDV